MLMRGRERRGGHGLNRHGKHAHKHTHAKQRLKAKLRSESSMGKLTSSSEGREKPNECVRLSASTLSIEDL